MRKSLRDSQVSKCIEEGRRLYVGNIPYEATVKDIETLFQDLAAGIDDMNMSVAAMTGRNPSYCFVDFKSRELAEAVIEEYNGREFMRRTLKVKPGIKSDRSKVSISRGTSGKLGERKRLFVGGLPEFLDQETADLNIQDLFQGFEIDTIGKLKVPQGIGDGKKKNCFCFVDLVKDEDADRALLELDWKEKWGMQVRVKPAMASSTPGLKVDNRRPTRGW